MNSRFKVGGLCLLIKSRFPERIGTTVELVRYAGYRDFQRENSWVIKHRNNIHNESILPSDQTFCGESKLIPLGDEESKKQFEKEKELENM